MPEPELSLLFIRPLNRLELRYVVSGSIAAILYGEPRLTHDVDFVVFLRTEDARRLHGAFLAPEFYVPSTEEIVAEILRAGKGHFNIIHIDTGFKADFYTTRSDEFDAWAFRNARKLAYQDEPVKVAPPEYVIVRKLEYYREGGSDKHLRDIRSMLAVSGEAIDHSILVEWVQRQSVHSEWQMVTDAGR
jgi:hypothetical protein